MTGPARRVDHVAIALAELRYQRSQYAKLRSTPNVPEHEMERQRSAVRFALKRFRELKGERQ